MTNEQSPKTPSSIIRNHSPYCESTGPIVQEGFVAARVRALQGLSDGAHNMTRSHSPLTPCPLHLYKSRSPPRPLALKPVLTGTYTPENCTVKRLHTHILSRTHRSLAKAHGGPARSSDVALSFQPQGQQSSPGPSTRHRSYVGIRGARSSLSKPFEDIVPSCSAQSNPVPAPSTPHGPFSELDRVNDLPAENSSLFEKSILSPHAIQADLVEPRATWSFLSEPGNGKSDWLHEQALKPRGSIADKLGSMVEQGWMGGDTFGKLYSDDEFASHASGSTLEIGDRKPDSARMSVAKLPYLEKVPLYSYHESISEASTQVRSQSHHSLEQGAPLYLKQNDARTIMYQGSQGRRKREAKRNYTASTHQRSISDTGVQYMKKGWATRNGNRPSWPLDQLGRSKSSHSQFQPQATPTIWPSHALALDHRTSEQDHTPMRLLPSRQGSALKCGFDLTMHEQLSQDSAALSRIKSPRRSSANSKASTRSASRSTSFFRKFPWYKVALVDKQSVAHTSSKGGCDGDSRAAHRDPNPNHIELSRGSSKSHTPFECEDEDDKDSFKTENPLQQEAIPQQTINATKSSYEVSSQPSLELMTSSQELNELQGLRQIQRVPERPHGSHNTRSKLAREPQLRDPYLAFKDTNGHEQGLIRIGRFSTQPRVLSRSSSMDTSFESAVTGDVLPSLLTQGPEVKGHPRVQCPTPSCSKSMHLPIDHRLEKTSSGSKTARPGYGFTARSSLSPGPRSEVVNSTPKRTGSGTHSLPAHIQRSDQQRPLHQETQVGGKGIKKIQVTVTFDGAEDLVIETTLRKRDRRED